MKLIGTFPFFSLKNQGHHHKYIKTKKKKKIATETISAKCDPKAGEIFFLYHADKNCTITRFPARQSVLKVKDFFIISWFDLQIYNFFKKKIQCM